MSCTRKAGPYQRQVERWLGLRVDGRQSAADCRAIRAFQVRQGIKPAIGFAGPVTCVDLSRQLMWVQKGRTAVFGAVPIRSGRAGYRTRAGWRKIYWRHKNHWSTLYNTPMPYSRFFSGGQAFHGVYGSLHTGVGSMGCVNLTVGDARRLWGVLKGDRVFVWGRRLGT